MDKSPVVSVIVSFLNAENFLQEAIDSVLAQTYGNWELLLVDDGSSDRSSQIAQFCARENAPKVRYLEHPGRENRGLATSRNLAISHSTGELIAILDSDDVWLPHKLFQQVALLGSHPEVAMVYGQSLYWHSWTGEKENAERDFMPTPGVQLDLVYEPPQLLIRRLRGALPSPVPSDLVFRRDAAFRLGRFEEAFKGMYGMYEDQAFLTKFFLHESVFVSSQSWDRYRIHPGSICAVQVREGNEHSIRRFYLDWLEQYLRDQGVTDREIWKPVTRMRRPFRYPRIARVSRYFRSILK